MKKRLIFIACLLISISTAFYILIKQDEHPDKNGFSRKFKNFTIRIKNAKQIGRYPFAFASSLDSNITIQFYSDQLSLYKINYDLTKIDTIKLRYPTSFNVKVKRISKDFFDKKIYSTNIFGDLAIQKEGDLKYSRIPNLISDRVKVLSSTGLVARAVSYDKNGQKKRELTKVNFEESRVIKRYKLPNLVNNLFVNDGVLYYDRLNHKIIYMYYYKGEFISLDTNLNLLYTGKTIDTIRDANISTKLIGDTRKTSKKPQRITSSRPPKFVNVCITSFGNEIYILSKIKADNESQNFVKNNQVIDVYNINTGSYLYSFYIPKYKNLKLRDFLVKENVIIAIFGQNLVTYIRL